MKGVDFNPEDFGQRGKKDTINSFTKEGFDSLNKSFPAKYITHCGTRIEGGFCQRIYFKKKFFNIINCLVCPMSLIFLKIGVTS